MKPSVFPGRVARLAVIASLVLQLSGMSMAAEPRATPPAAPAADPTVSLRFAFEANRGTPPSATSVGDGMSHASRTTASAVRRLL